MNRSTLILIGVFLLLGLLVILLLPGEEERMTSDSVPEFAVTVDSGSVVKIEIEHPGRSVILENVGGTWMITSPMRVNADPAAVRQVLSGILKLQIGSLVSSNPDKQSLYQVDSTGTKLTVTERSGRTVALIVGKEGPSFSEVYLRAPQSADVYLAGGLDAWMINKELKEWRDRSILTLEADMIREIVYSIGKKVFAFRRDSTNWWMNGAPMGDIIMKPVLNVLPNLRAEEFIDTAITPSTQPIILTVRAADEQILTFYPVPPDSLRYIVTSSVTPQTYTVNKWTFRQITTPITMYLQ